MAISPSGRFRYVVVVPDGAPDSSRDWPVTSFDAREPVGNHNADERLVGLTPTLRITNAGLTPNPSPARPRVLRSRLTLTARTSHLAAVAGASFCVDKAIVGTLQPGDHLHMVRTGCGGLGVSVVRDDRLVAAAGAVTHLPLGNDVHARIPYDLVDEASAVFAKRDPGFHLPEYPVEFQVGEQVHIRPSSGAYGTMMPYRLVFFHGYREGIPGQDECAAIWHPDRCPDVAASATAQLLG